LSSGIIGIGAGAGGLLADDGQSVVLEQRLWLLRGWFCGAQRKKCCIGATFRAVWKKALARSNQ